MISALYYFARALQVLGMWLLLLDVFVYAGPLGPDPKLFGAGIGVFLAGWVLVRQFGRK